MSKIENKWRLDKQDFHLALREFDVAVCEACAVSEGIGVQMAKPYIGWSTHLFTRMCIHAQLMITSCPESRWVKKDFEFWDLSSVAPHARALIEANLLFYYISKEPESTNEWSAKLNVMHLNDCKKRIDFFSSVEDEAQVKAFETQKEEILQRLENNDFFNSLPEKRRNKCLSGKFLMIPDRKELLDEMGISHTHFGMIFDLLSHYTHILTMSYYRMEPNGRGTGCFNDSDLHYITVCLMLCTQVMVDSTNRMVDFFPITKRLRKGLRSKFSFGPKVKK